MPTHKLLGLGYRTPHYREVLETKPPLGFFEIISENFTSSAPKPRRFLEELRTLYPIAMHGVSLSIGGQAPISHDYLKKIKRLMEWLKPEFVSDHLCWTDFNAHNSHDLLPMPYTEASLRHVGARVEQVQNFLGRKILLENPSAYVEFANNQMTELEFLARLHEQTGCGVLLDLNNLFVNQNNLGASALGLIRGLPLSSVGYFHLAGHSVQGEALIDTHDHPVADAVWPLYQEAVKRWPNALTLLEWDGNIPELSGLLTELDRVAKARSEVVACQETASSPAVGASTHIWTQSQESFFKWVVDQEGDSSKYLMLAPHLRQDLPVPADHGAKIYQDAYRLRFVEVFSDIFSALSFLMETDGFATTVMEYLEKFPPKFRSISQEGQSFALFLASGDFSFDFGVEPGLLSELAALDWSQVEVFEEKSEVEPVALHLLKEISSQDWESLVPELQPAHRLLPLHWQTVPAWRELLEEKTPPIPEQQENFALVFRKRGDIFVEELSVGEAIIFQAWRDGKKLSELEKGVNPEAQSAFLVRALSLALIVGFSQ